MYSCVCMHVHAYVLGSGREAGREGGRNDEVNEDAHSKGIQVVGT